MRMCRNQNLTLEKKSYDADYATAVAAADDDDGDIAADVYVDATLSVFVLLLLLYQLLLLLTTMMMNMVIFVLILLFLLLLLLCLLLMLMTVLLLYGLNPRFLLVYKCCLQHISICIIHILHLT